MEQFVQLPRRDAAHFVRRSEENASGVRTDTPRIPLKASRKNRYLEIVSLDVRRERAMLLQQRRWMLTQFPAGRSRLK
jgi:hypothetical protein